MTKLKTLALGAVIAALGVGYAVGQAITSTTLTGNEVIVAALGGPGGSSIFVPVQELRNAQGVATSAATTGAVAYPPAAATLIWTATVSGAVTLTTPATPWDGEILEIVNGSGANNTATVTLTANTGQTVIAGGVATLANSASAEWRYAQSTTTWYRMR